MGKGTAAEEPTKAPVKAAEAGNDNISECRIQERKQMELYIHIPFCIRKCRYCDFLSFPANDAAKERYVDQLMAEISALGEECREYEVTSIFMGGGTPSLLLPEQTRRIMESVRASFHVSDQAEITTEANPGTVDPEKLKIYRECGINRLSLGLQSAVNRELEELGRIHNCEAFLESFQAARRAGFDNINIDLMSALPGQNMESYKATLKTATELEPEHISAYSLIIEEGTPFYERYGEAERKAESSGGHSFTPLPDEEEEREMYHYTKAFLREKGYERYEISNYARKGRECIHNTGYWTGVEYLGLGLGASSCMRGKRFSNEKDLDIYLKFTPEDFRCKRHHCETETLTVQAEMEEFMFLGLRLTRGISLMEFERRFGRSVGAVYGEVLERFLSEGLMVKTEWKYEADGMTASGSGTDVRLRLTDYGTDLSNYVLSGFLL